MLLLIQSKTPASLVVLILPRQRILSLRLRAVYAPAYDTGAFAISSHQVFVCVASRCCVHFSQEGEVSLYLLPFQRGVYLWVPKVLAQLLGRLRMSPTHHHTSLGLPRALSFRWYVAYSLSALSAGMIL